MGSVRDGVSVRNILVLIIHMVLSQDLARTEAEVVMGELVTSRQKV